MAAVLAFDHDLNLGKKGQNVSAIKLKVARHHEQQMGRVRARFHSNHFQKTIACNDSTDADERAENCQSRSLIDTDEIDKFFAPVDKDKRRAKHWFWLKGGGGHGF
jgi:hypothetical protein